MFSTKKRIADMTDQEVEDRITLLDEKLKHTGRVVDILKTGNAVIIMLGVLVTGILSGGLTLGTAAAGLVIGVVAMGSIRASAETQSQGLARRRETEMRQLEAEQDRRTQQALTSQQQALEQQRRDAEQQLKDRADASRNAQALERSIEKDFNEGVSQPIAIGTTLSLKKRDITASFLGA